MPSSSPSSSLVSFRVFIFYRDLRLDDNLTWLEMFRKSVLIPQQQQHQQQHSPKRNSSSRVIPIFILDHSEWPSKNQYQFLLECLVDLDRELRKHGSKLSILTRVACQKFLRDYSENIEMIGWNAQYEHPERYDFIRNMMATSDHPRRPLHCALVELEDAFMVPPSKLHHAPFKKFTPFYRHCTRSVRIPRPQPFQKSTLRTSCRLGKLPREKTYHPLNLHALYQSIPRKNVHFYTQGGYRNAWRQLMYAKNHLRKYGQTRNYLSIPTSHLSAYLSLNVLSIRRVYYTMKGVSEEFVRELYWRDFYLYVAKYFPKVLAFGEHITAIPSSKLDKWKKWKQGTTGIPIVDACMRQLNTTGFMHNRGRMIVASYLIKNLHIHFKHGERYFEKTLYDHNLASNNGGWQWVNGSGVDSQPRYQKFNMLLQTKKYDPECVFIKMWLPHLESLSPTEIFEMY